MPADPCVHLLPLFLFFVSQICPEVSKLLLFPNEQLMSLTGERLVLSVLTGEGLQDSFWSRSWGWTGSLCHHHLLGTCSPCPAPSPSPYLGNPNTSQLNLPLLLPPLLSIPLPPHSPVPRHTELPGPVPAPGCARVLRAGSHHFLAGESLCSSTPSPAPAFRTAPVSQHYVPKAPQTPVLLACVPADDFPGGGDGDPSASQPRALQHA